MPDETHNKVRASLNEILRSNIHDVTTNGLCGVNAEDLVLGDAERVELGLVDHTLVNGFGHGIIDQFTARN